MQITLTEHEYVYFGNYELEKVKTMTNQEQGSCHLTEQNTQKQNGTKC